MKQQGTKDKLYIEKELRENRSVRLARYKNPREISTIFLTRGEGGERKETNATTMIERREESFGRTLVLRILWTRRGRTKETKDRRFSG